MGSCATTHEISIDGPLREYYLRNAGDTPGEAGWRTEFGWRIFAVAPDGAVVTLAASGLPPGGGVGVESTGFVPPGFGACGAAYLADRYCAGNKHPRTNSILRLPGADLVRAGVRAGDLLAAMEASARIIVVHCAGSCTVR